MTWFILHLSKCADVVDLRCQFGRLAGHRLAPLGSGSKMSTSLSPVLLIQQLKTQSKLEMWANAQRDGRPAEYMWRPLFNAAVWLRTTSRVGCSNAAKTRNPLKFAGEPQTNETISAASGPKFTIL